MNIIKVILFQDNKHIQRIEMYFSVALLDSIYVLSSVRVIEDVLIS